jgi:PPK2 family polyphosphate:nucleotide phosphotransferase
MAKTSIDLRAALRVPPGGDTFDLGAVDPRATPGLPDSRVVRQNPKGWARADTAAVVTELDGYQERLYASAKHGVDGRRVLLVLQAMDCGGKDGTIKHIVGALNPQGVQIANFGPPSEEERRHHFLWRIRRALPNPGYVGVFNRSHYEDVLVVRVHGLVSRRVWQVRYGQINKFERGLVDAGYALLKVMLHISPEEQLARLLARLDDPAKHWKYNPGDVDERGRWADYMAAYGDALGRCSTEEAPWYVVPADRKWYRDWAVAHLLRDTFADLRPTYPAVGFDPTAERARLHAASSRIPQAA